MAVSVPTGLLALTTGYGKKAQEILEEAVFPISEALRSRSESSKIASVFLHIISSLVCFMSV